MRLGDVGHCLPFLPSPETSVRPTPTPPTIPSCPHHRGPRAAQLQGPGVQGQRGHHASRGDRTQLCKEATSPPRGGWGRETAADTAAETAQMAAPRLSRSKMPGCASWGPPDPAWAYSRPRFPLELFPAGFCFWRLTKQVCLSSGGQSKWAETVQRHSEICVSSAPQLGALSKMRLKICVQGHWFEI